MSGLITTSLAAAPAAPRGAATLASVLRAAWTWVAMAWMRHAERRELRHLDDRMLKDMGLSRSEVAEEARKRFWEV